MTAAGEAGCRKTKPSNKGMKLTRPVEIGASQLIWHAPCQAPRGLFVR